MADRKITVTSDRDPTDRSIIDPTLEQRTDDRRFNNPLNITAYVLIARPTDQLTRPDRCMIGPFHSMVDALQWAADNADLEGGDRLMPYPDMVSHVIRYGWCPIYSPMEYKS